MLVLGVLASSLHHLDGWRCPPCPPLPTDRPDRVCTPHRLKLPATHQASHSQLNSAFLVQFVSACLVPQCPSARQAAGSLHRQPQFPPCCHPADLQPPLLTWVQPVLRPEPSGMHRLLPGAKCGQAVPQPAAAKVCAQVAPLPRERLCGKNLPSLPALSSCSLPPILALRGSSAEEALAGATRMQGRRLGQRLGASTASALALHLCEHRREDPNLCTACRRFALPPCNCTLRSYMEHAVQGRGESGVVAQERQWRGATQQERTQSVNAIQGGGAEGEQQEWVQEG